MVSHIEGCQIVDGLNQRRHQGCQAERVEGKMWCQGPLCHLSRFCDMWGGARKGSAKSDGTLKHSDSLT